MSREGKRKSLRGRALQKNVPAEENVAPTLVAAHNRRRTGYPSHRPLRDGECDPDSPAYVDPEKHVTTKHSHTPDCSARADRLGGFFGLRRR